MRSNDEVVPKRTDRERSENLSDSPGLDLIARSALLLRQRRQGFHSGRLQESHKSIPRSRPRDVSNVAELETTKGNRTPLAGAEIRAAVACRIIDELLADALDSSGGCLLQISEGQRFLITLLRCRKAVFTADAVQSADERAQKVVRRQDDQAASVFIILVGIEDGGDTKKNHEILKISSHQGGRLHMSVSHPA